MVSVQLSSFCFLHNRTLLITIASRPNLGQVAHIVCLSYSLGVIQVGSLEQPMLACCMFSIVTSIALASWLSMVLVWCPFVRKHGVTGRSHVLQLFMHLLHRH
ncbi:hypothetical protein RJT34_05214 [Clitoria ternatea]|uniref:Uncharacterized protein n=1 Tax=Clitoria ternatea TaxID=43366 RepID=A0AAN9K2Q3_CLITE